jgi:sortase A
MTRWKQILKNAVAILLVAAGILMLAYPAAAQYASQKDLQQAADVYEQNTADTSVDRISQMLEEAQAYNASLLKNPDPFTLTDEEEEQLHSLLSVNDDGIIGSIEIEKIGVYLPIYHGLGDDALSGGIGHMDGSSLPVGGESTHCILAGHTGSPDATLFSNLGELEEGDEIKLHVLNMILVYTVDTTEVVDPSNAQGMSIHQGQDLLTLITCTPYGINSQRLLVRAHRTGTLSADTSSQTEKSRDIVLDWWAWTGLILAGIITAAAVVFCILFLKNKKTKSVQEKQLENKDQDGKQTD